MVTTSLELQSTVFSKKRKRGTNAGEKHHEPKMVTKKQRTATEDDLDLSIGINKSLAQMDSRLLADYMAQTTIKFENDLSSVELEDRYIPGNYRIISLLAVSN